MVPSKPVNINKQIESTIRKGSLSDHTDEPKQAKHLMPANGADSPSESSGALRENRASETAPIVYLGTRPSTHKIFRNGGAGALLASGGVL